jgi:sugar transferase (PEP-CTERM/EpsH1 system associated)
MRIFFICQRVPFPPDRGDKITTFNEIHHLGQTHEVHVFCLADGREDLANIDGLRDCTASVTAVPISPLRSRLRALQALLGSPSLSVAAMHEASLHAAIRQRFAALRPDLVMVYSSNVAQYGEPFAQTSRIMQFAELVALKWRDSAARAAPPMRWIYALEARRLLHYERHIARTFSHSLVCTEAEAQEFRAAIPDAPVSIVHNGVNLDYFSSAGTPKRAGELVFTGVMNYTPNVDAVRWFCADILPRVRQAVPQAQLTICGSRPIKAVQRLAADPGVVVTGRVPDVRPYLDRAEVFVAPLRLARGIQNKVLEAMAMGLPVVASDTVWNGTAIAEGEGIVAADTAEAFAAQVVRLLRDASYRTAMGMRARAVVEQNYRWSTQLAALDRVVADVAAA